MTPEPPFKPLPLPLNFGNPFGDLADGNDLYAGYVAREDKDIEVVIEIKSWRRPDGIDRRWAGEPMDSGEVELGDAWTPDGRWMELTPEERARFETEFLERMIKGQNEQAHDADY